MKSQELYKQLLILLQSDRNLFGSADEQEIEIVLPNGFQSAAQYEICLDVERLGSIRCVLKPGGMMFSRVDRGTVRTTHEVNLTIYGKTDNDRVVEYCVDKVQNIARYFLIDDPLIDADCIGVQTLSGAEAGYDPQEYEDTPGVFVGGLRLTINTYS